MSKKSGGSDVLYKFVGVPFAVVAIIFAILIATGSCS